jgi:hypothetical protein
MEKSALCSKVGARGRKKKKKLGLRAWIGILWPRKALIRITTAINAK